MMKHMHRNTMVNKENRSKHVYLYNLVQAQYFLDHGLYPIAVGRGTQEEVFLKFKRDAATEEVFQSWNTYVQNMKARNSDGDDDEKTNQKRIR